ncbi:hypothetical protein [Corynebacterium frankenforstense]|uniref:hypothetical protein n=1 Tax=Corynebacterium frankenforstense TaxID=1230998 RepID=UPI0026EF9722|nr:hypothetical protein [Corynebacterium frankenforstense]
MGAYVRPCAVPYAFLRGAGRLRPARESPGVRPFGRSPGLTPQHCQARRRLITAAAPNRATPRQQPPGHTVTARLGQRAGAHVGDLQDRAAAALGGADDLDLGVLGRVEYLGDHTVVRVDQREADRLGQQLETARGAGLHQQVLLVELQRLSPGGQKPSAVVGQQLVQAGHGLPAVGRADLGGVAGVDAQAGSVTR